MRDSMRRYLNQLFSIFISLLFIDGPYVNACIGGSGGGGSACCPAASTVCAPSVPVCPSYGYSSYSAGGSYAAPQSSYPRPYGVSSPCSSGGCGAAAPAPCASSSSGGCGGGVQVPISIVSPAIAAPPSYASAPVASYPQPLQPIGASYSAPLPAPPPPPQPQPAPSSYGAQIPQPAPGPELENNYEDQHVQPPGPNYGDQPPQPPPAASQPYNENTAAPPPPDYSANEGKQNYDNTAASEAPPQAKSIYDNQHDYADETNALGGSEPASVAPASTTGADDTAALNCEDPELRKIVESALQQSQDNLDAARKIESEAAARFGGRFNSIVSNSEFAYVNWYGKRNCQLRVNDRHSLTWED